MLSPRTAETQKKGQPSASARLFTSDSASMVSGRSALVRTMMRGFWRRSGEYAPSSFTSV